MSIWKSLVQEFWKDLAPVSLPQMTLYALMLLFYAFFLVDFLWRSGVLNSHPYIMYSFISLLSL